MVRDEIIEVNIRQTITISKTKGINILARSDSAQSSPSLSELTGVNKSDLPGIIHLLIHLHSTSFIHMICHNICVQEKVQNVLLSDILCTHGI